MSSIEIHIISNRPLLDEFTNKWNTVVISNELNENVVIKVLTTDYDEKRFTLDNGIKVEYIKQKTFPKTTFMNQAWARNELLCYANSEYILFFDDWQIPGPDILAEHTKYLTQEYIVCGMRSECDRDGNNCKKDTRLKHKGVKACDYGHFWTCNASAKLSDILRINGFDNRYNGGTAGEDYDMGMRLSRLGIKMIYNGDASCRHSCHDHLRVKLEDNIHDHPHDLSPYKYLPEYGHSGDWNLMKSNTFEFWWEGPIKYYRCKICGITGILDSIQVFHFNRDNNVTIVEDGVEQVRKNLEQEIARLEHI